MSELFTLTIEQKPSEHWEPVEQEKDPLEEYLAWRHDFHRMVAEWEKSETENREEQDVVLTGLAVGNPNALAAERLQLLQQSLAGSVSTQFLGFLTNPFYVGAMLVSYHSLTSGGEGIEVSDDLPMADHLSRYQEETLREREQHRHARELLARA